MDHKSFEAAGSLRRVPPPFELPADLRLVETSDGVRIALHDLGGAGPTLLIAHATGFHGRTYAPFAASLAQRFHSEAIDERGHGLSGLPPDLDFDWNGFALDALAAASATTTSGPLYGFGHSAGGSALLVAELMRPGTFAAIYCFEPVVFPSDEPLPPIPDIPLSVAARRRREVFGSRSEAFENYRSKPPLAALDAESLSAYVEHGFEDLPDGTVRLLCRRENEAAVYAAGSALNLYSRLAEVDCRVVLGGGAETQAITPEHLELLAARLSGSKLDVFKGLGHFGPLEDHARVAASVADLLLG